MKKLIIFIFAAVVVSCAPSSYYPDISTTKSSLGTDHFRPDSSSVERVYPDWFIDSKLGIMARFGLYSLVSQEESYVREINMDGSAAQSFHTKRFGSVDDFGYEDLAPMLQPKRFRADDWIDLFAGSGAQYVVSLAESQDGFAMYNSVVNDWNSAETGGRIDFVGELSKSARKRGLPLGIASYHDCDGADWLMHTYELVDLYKPDFMLFGDFQRSVKTSELINRLSAYYYNSADDWGRDVFVGSIGVVDSLEVTMRDPWLMEYPIHSDSYSIDSVVDKLVDVVSRNGNMLLSVYPKPDGSIGEDESKLLRELGDWLRVNGEAIYKTRPWVLSQEGVDDTSSDVRYTMSDDAIYAITSDWRQFSYVMLRAFAAKQCPKLKVESIKMLGTNENIEWEHSSDGLRIKFPIVRPSGCAHVFKIKYSGDIPIY